jgi:PAS domain S-box-containing protein
MEDLVCGAIFGKYKAEAFENFLLALYLTLHTLMKPIPANKFYTDEKHGIFVISGIIAYCVLSFLFPGKNSERLFFSPLTVLSGVLSVLYTLLLVFYLLRERRWSNLNKIMIFTCISLSIYLSLGLFLKGYDPFVPWFYLFALLLFSTYFNNLKTIRYCVILGYLPLALAHFLIRDQIPETWIIFPLYAFLFIVGCYFILSKAFSHKKKFNEKNKELELKNHEVENILNSIKSLISFKDSNNKFININEALAQRLGQSRSELIGTSLYDLIGYEQAKSFHDEDLQIIADGKARLNVLENVSLTKNSEKSLWFRSNKTPFVDSNSKVIGIILHSEDVTEEMEAVKKNEESERRLLTYSRQLEDSNQNLQEFAYVISHDLREPLRTVTAYTQLLKRQLKPEDQTQNIQDFMHFIVDAAKRMDGQINGILEYSRVGRSDLNMESLSLYDIIDTLKRILYLQIIETNATIEIECEDLMLYGDKMQLTQLFQNLISNSLKYKKPEVNPIVKINAISEGTMLKLTVNDNGIGIEEPYLENIFGVFRRLHTHTDVEGSGIGLSICRRILQRHFGKIWVESTFGEGTTFIFTLPIS